MRKVKGIDDSLRLQIIEEHLGGKSKCSLAKQYKLKYPQLITTWMRIFGLEDSIKPIPEGFMRRKKEKEKEETGESLQRLKLENKRLKTALAQAELKARAYDTMIDVAEDMFKIPIRKKPGTKQS